ncbi:hypothetical protein L195_g033095 [Trifolium pratense]|uniref:Uncharacterized protein n=1 Tax=Trifolium pratense TaxID=57577 RepID=A0A2K3LF12_TRIPR|nr:hypothetical protein L195_g033095 [Trifolium pratense]
MTAIGSRYLLIGGFDGKSTYGEPWWLVPQDDPIATRLTAAPPRNIPESKDAASLNDPACRELIYSHRLCQENQSEKFPLAELQRRLQISVSQPNSRIPIVNELEDKELLELASRLAGENVSANSPKAIEALREYWKKAEPNTIKFKELGPLLRDYQRLIHRLHLEKSASDQQPGFDEHVIYQFYHVKNVSQVFHGARVQFIVGLIVGHNNTYHTSDFSLQLHSNPSSPTGLSPTVQQRYHFDCCHHHLAVYPSA